MRRSACDASSMFEQDLETLFEDPLVANVQVCYQGTCTRGQRTQGDAMHQTDAGPVQVRVDTVVIRKGTLPTMSGHVRITVDGQTCRVDRIAPVDGGASLRLFLASAP